jgi:hypothetical protein
MTKDEALKLALEALEGLFGTAEQFEGGGVAVWRLGGSHQPKQAIAALRLAIDVQNMASESTYKEAIANHIEDNLVMVQEPVAWYYPDGSPEQCTTDKAYAEMEPAWTPLYTIPPPCPTCEALARTVMLDQTAHDTPPQRPWVGLTDEERKEIWWSCEQQTPTTFVKAIEQALKEKNV